MYCPKLVRWRTVLKLHEIQEMSCDRPRLDCHLRVIPYMSNTVPAIEGAEDKLRLDEAEVGLETAIDFVDAARPGE